MTIISERINRFEQSLTVKISQKARELRLKGRKVISLSSGEPDFDTPDHIKSKAIEAIKDGFTKYTQVDGIIELKESIKNKLKKENNLHYECSQITVGVGGKHVIYNLFMSSIDKNDEVIIPAPYWVSYPDIISLCGGKPVVVETSMSENFKITPQLLEKNISDKTKWFIINSPCNPTGAVYSKEEIKEIASVLLKYPSIMILSDDIYEHIIYENKTFYNILNVEPKLFNRTFLVNGVSKAYSMTGWRIGYGAGPKEIIKAMAKIQSQSTTNPSSISQAAAVEALSGRQDFIKIRSDSFKERRDFVVKTLNNIKGLSCLKPSGAFYVFPNCKKLLGKKTKLKTDKDFVEKLLAEAEVAVVQGSAFGLDGYFRISYATSMDNLKKALERIKSFCESLT